MKSDEGIIKELDKEFEEADDKEEFLSNLIDEAYEATTQKEEKI